LLFTACLAVTAIGAVHLPEKSQALAQAVVQNDIATVQRLIQENADLNAVVFGATALHLAAEYGQSQIVRLVLEKGANVDPVDNLGRTPLLWAAENGHSDIVQLLVSHGADVNREDAGEWRGPLDEKPAKTSLNYAVAQGNTELARILISSGAKVIRNDIALLQDAIRSGKSDLVSLLIQQGVNPAAQTKGGDNAFATAGWVGNVDILKVLLAKHRTVSGTRALLNDALQHATENGRTELVRFLLENTNVDLDRQVDSSYGGVERLADTNKRVPGYTALSRAVENNHQEMIEVLLQKGAHVVGRTRSGAPLLSFAVSQDRDNLFKWLMRYHPPLEDTDYDGRTALMTAAMKGKVEMAKILVQRGAKIDKPDSVGATALLRACEAGSKHVIEYLLDAGANINDHDNEGRDALAYAAMGGHDGVCNLLIVRGAKVNAIEPKTGMTALHWAAKNARPVAVKELLAQGARRDVVDKQNKKPLDYARLAGDPETINRLEGQ
jgi:ankyrin